MILRCSKCKQEKEDIEFHRDRCSLKGYASQCKECRNNYDRTRDKLPHRKKKCKKYNASTEGSEKIRKKQRNNYKQHNYKFVAKRLVYKAIQNGTLKQEPCGICGDVKSVGHHEDYSKPLEVIWLCRGHHAQAHRNSLHANGSIRIKGKSRIASKIN